MRPLSVVAVDPGYEQSAWVRFDGNSVTAHAIEPNEALLNRLRSGQFTAVSGIVFEAIESFGMAVGRETFETVFWTGRFFEVALREYGTAHVTRMPRRAVKVHLCQSARAQDSNIRVALLDRFGGKEAAIGRKAAPGPLYGIKSHEWSALAIAVTWVEQRSEERMRA